MAPTKRPTKDSKGYSILELTVVIGILAIFASIAIPSIFNWIKLSRIDGVKTLLNSAAAECLQKGREGADMSTEKPPEDMISNANLETYGYKLSDTSTTCEDLKVVPKESDEKFLYELGFRIEPDLNVIKVAIPADDAGSLKSCKNWAGINCGASPEQLKKWADEAALNKLKSQCLANFQTWLNKPSTGTFTTWDDTTNTCTLERYACEGSLVASAEAIVECMNAKQSAACLAKFKAIENSTPPPHGLYPSSPDAQCGQRYFCYGKDLATDDKTQWDACVAEKQGAACTAEINAWKATKINGQFVSKLGCSALWQCNSNGNQTIYTSQMDYEKSEACGCTNMVEKVQIGSTIESYNCGTKRICSKYKGNLCLQWVDQIQYCTRVVPVYGEKLVCVRK